MIETFAGKPVIDPAFTDDAQSNSVTKQVDGKFVLRPSSLNVHCYYSYAQNAILGKKSKPSGASAGGTAYHYALELGYEHKIRTGENPPMPIIQEIARENWRIAQTKEELHFSERDSADKMTDDIVNGVKAYHPIMSRVQPVATEIRLSVALPKPSSVYSQISGSMDLVAKAGNVVAGVQPVEIIDHKFTTKIATSPKYKLQAGMYRIMAHSNGWSVASTVLHNTQRSQILKTKTNPPRTELVRPTWDASVATNIQARVNSLIDMGEMYNLLVNNGVDREDAVKVVYPTTTPEVSFLCSPLWCGWWSSCFEGDVQILTSKGFTPFKDIKDDVVVAQVSSDLDSVSFVKPNRVVREKDRGDLVRVRYGDALDVVCTADHEFVFKYQKSKQSPTKIVRVWAEDLLRSDRYHLVKGVKLQDTVCTDTLTQDEMLTIAFQADGYKVPIVTSEYASVQFHVSKYRKRQQLIKDFSIEDTFRVLNRADETCNISFRVPSDRVQYITKSLRDVFDISTMSLSKARAFIEYITLWDGSRQGDVRYLYFSTDKDNASLVQEVALMCGYRTTLREREGTSEHYKTVYTVNINKIRKTTSTRNVSVERLGGAITDVFCVTVPTGNIVIRDRNGDVAVVGNCPMNNTANMPKVSLVDMLKGLKR